jgi:solute carrier family 25 citrate transporter 1
MAPVSGKPKHKGKAVLAGGLSGVVEICMTYPTEFVKTSMQLNKGNTSIGGIVKKTIQESGFGGLYRGLPSMVWFAAPKASIRFGAFEMVSGMLKTEDGRDKYGLGAAQGFVAGLAAGTLEAIFVTTPQETIKVRLINDAFRTDGPPKYKSFFHGVRTIIKESGWGGIYHGVTPTIVKVSTAQATRFGIFQVIPAEYRSTPLKSALCGAFAGGMSVVMFQGIDVVKSRMQGLDASKYRSTVHCIGEIMRHEGIRGFYKGMAPRLTRVCLEVGITMTLYGEIVKGLNAVWKTE